MLLELEHIQKDYDTGGKKLSVLKDINLQVQEKETIAIVGPSGCGKSTLLNIMGGLDYPSSGKVLFNGQEIYKLANKQLARIRNTQIGFIFQLHHLLPLWRTF